MQFIIRALFVMARVDGWSDRRVRWDKPVNLRLGPGPDGPLIQELQVMGEKWRQASEAAPADIFPGGTQGRGDMVGLMQTGNLDAGLLTAVGFRKSSQRHRIAKHADVFHI